MPKTSNLGIFYSNEIIHSSNDIPIAVVEWMLHWQWTVSTDFRSQRATGRYPERHDDQRQEAVHLHTGRYRPVRNPQSAHAETYRAQPKRTGHACTSAGCVKTEAAPHARGAGRYAIPDGIFRVSVRPGSVPAQSGEPAQCEFPDYGSLLFSLPSPVYRGGRRFSSTSISPN